MKGRINNMDNVDIKKLCPCTISYIKDLIEKMHQQNEELNNKYTNKINEIKSKFRKLPCFPENAIELSVGNTLEINIKSYQCSIVTNNIENEVLNRILRKLKNI